MTDKKLSQVLKLLRGEKERKFFLKLYNKLPYTMQKRYMSDALIFKVFLRYHNEHLDSLGHGNLSDFSPQEDIIKYFYFECKDETRFVFSFKDYLTRLIWIQRLATWIEFYLYDEEPEQSLNKVRGASCNVPRPEII